MTRTLLTVKNLRPVTLVFCLAFFGAGMLTACSEQGSAEKTGERVDRAIENAGDAMREAADDTREAIDKAADGTRKVVDEAADDIRDAVDNDKD